MHENSNNTYLAHTISLPLCKNHAIHCTMFTLALINTDRGCSLELISRYLLGLVHTCGQNLRLSIDKSPILSVDCCGTNPTLYRTFCHRSTPATCLWTVAELFLYRHKFAILSIDKPPILSVDCRETNPTWSGTFCHASTPATCLRTIAELCLYRHKFAILFTSVYKAL